MGNKLRLGSMAALVWLLAACSPYSYSKEISTFSASVDKLSDAYSASFDAIAVARASELQAHALSERSLGNNPKFAISTVCNSSSVPKSGDPEPCALYLRDQPPPKFTDAERNRKPATIALKALKDYVSALAAVTNAQDRSAYDTAVSQLSGAVGTILTPANAVAPGSSVAVSAGINVFGWIVGTALDEQRYDSLKKAVELVGKPVKSENDKDYEDNVIGGLQGIEWVILMGNAV